MNWIRMDRRIAAVAMLGVVMASIPSSAHSQQRSSFEGRAGVAVPTGRLAKIADAGPNVGIQLARPIGDRVALDLRGDVDMLQGTRLSSHKAPNVRLWRYGAGIETRILPVQAGRWALTADLGVGATTMDTDEFTSPDNQSRRDFTETYFTSGAGIRLQYEVNSRVSTHLGAGAQWASTNPDETRALQAIDPTRIRQFSSAWSVPVTMGVKVRTGFRQVAEREPPARPASVVSQASRPRASDDGRDRARLEAMAILQERVHFDFDRFEIKPEFAIVLDRKVDVLREFPELSILIEGHCDEWGSVEYNQALGHRRATAVMDYLTQRGVSASRLQTTSYGKERPLVAASSEQAWSQNRRAEFVVLDPDAVTASR